MLLPQRLGGAALPRGTFRELPLGRVVDSTLSGMSDWVVSGSELRWLVDTDEDWFSEDIFAFYYKGGFVASRAFIV